jgi:RNA polymerase sigma-70 factor, ECF subfamily
MVMLAPAAIRSEPALADEPSLDFDLVYAEHFDFVWRNLRRLGVPESCLRDAAQEVFLVVYRRIGEFVPKGSLRSWIYSILRRVALAQKRQHRRWLPEETRNAENLADESGSDPEIEAARGQALRLLLELLDGLDDDKRDALVVVDIEGMSVPEACMALDVNLNTLYSRLRAARQQMRQRLALHDRDDWRQR